MSGRNPGLISTLEGAVAAEVLRFMPLRFFCCVSSRDILLLPNAPRRLRDAGYGRRVLRIVRPRSAFGGRYNAPRYCLYAPSRFA